MSVPFAINGLGRIGRALLRIAAARDDLRLVAVNDLVPAETLARLIARDSVHGPFAGHVEAAAGAIVLDGRRVPVTAAREPAQIPWRESGARVVVEATGAFTARAAAAGHLGGAAGGGAAADEAAVDGRAAVGRAAVGDAAVGKAAVGNAAVGNAVVGDAAGEDGAVERVVLSANAEDADVTLCLGVNDGDYDPARHHVISNASCTTNCLAPLVAVLDLAFGVERATMTAVHGYTGNQRLLDADHPEPRRRRAAALNVLPTATTTPRALGRVLPRLAGRVAGMAVRVPVPMAALLELVVHLERPAGAGEVRDLFRAAAADGPLAGILGVCEEELVSSDFVGDARSAVVDLPLVEVVDGRLARVAAWYDNEWGYASRLADLVARL